MTDKTPTHIPAEGEGTPLLPGETDLRPQELPAQEDATGNPVAGDVDLVPGTSPGAGQ